MGDRDNLRAGERRVAAILFSDMKSFTSLTAGMDPEELDGLMNRIFGAFTEIIRAYGGIVEKYIGDALVAVFGAPEPHEDDASRAAHAALEFMDRIREEKSRNPATNEALTFRSGIYEGLVTTGRRGGFDVVTGHAMSLAQRLEAAAAPGSILVSETVKEKCEAEFEFGARQSIEAKGLAEPVAAFELIGARAQAQRDTGPFIGREDIVEQMLGAYIRDRDDEVSGFYISGEAGIGKTRLMQNLEEKIRRFPDFSAPQLRATAQKFGTRNFAVIIDMILAYLGLDPRKGRSAAESAIARFPSIPETSRSRFVDLVCRHEAERIDSDSVAPLYDVFEAILEGRSGRLFPILVAVDNAPFMDRLSREFFQYLFKTGRIKPFFLLAGRDFPPELRKIFQGLKTLKLTALSGAESEKLVRARWPEVETDALRRIVEAGMGNPLFLREYVDFARKRRDASILPATVQNIVLAGLERYNPEWRELAKRLSVFEVSFTVEDARFLQRLAGGREDFVEEAIFGFLKDGLFAAKDGEHSFRVDAYKKALYASLLNHNKRVLHGLVADLMIRQEDPNKPHLLLHLARAERYDEAARVLVDDPDPGSNYEALPYIDLLIHRLKEDRTTSFRLLMAKAAILFSRGELEESEAVVKRIMRIALARKDDTLLGYAYHQICAHAATSCAFQKAIFTGKKALHYYGNSSQGPRDAQKVLHLVAESNAMLNEFDEARRLVERCERMPGGDPSVAAAARGMLDFYKGDYAQALVMADRVLATTPEEYASQIFFALDFKLDVLWQLCDFQGIKENAQRLLSLGRLSENSLSRANAMLALADFLSGGRESSRDRFVQAEFYAGQIRNDFERVEALGVLALACFYADDAKRAEDLALEALTLGLRHSSYWPTFALLVLMAWSLAGRGDKVRARFFLGEASFFFTTGLLLPPKELILYYYLSARLLEPSVAARSFAVAARLFDEEKVRLGTPQRLEAFLSLPPFAEIQTLCEDASIREADGDGLADFSADASVED